MPGVRWWAPVSALAAPVLLVGGWIVAQLAQPPGFSAVSDTISALARDGLDHRWIMTLGLAGLGAAHVATAAGLPGLRRGSRAVLALAGLATIGAAAFPQPFTGSSPAHGVTATIAFVALAVWPATTATRAADPARRPPVAIAASVVSGALLVWFVATLGTDVVGLSERVLTTQQALWPLVVVLSLRGVRGSGPAADATIVR